MALMKHILQVQKKTVWVDMGPIRNKGKSADLVFYKSPEERKGHTEGHGKVQIREKG